MFQPPDSETFPLRPTPRYCQSSTDLPSSNHCIHKGSTKIASSHWFVVHPDITRKKTLQDVPRHRELHPVLDLPLCGSYQEIIGLVVQLVTPRLALYLTRHLRRLCYRQPCSSFSPARCLPREKARQDTKPQHRHQASPLAASLQPTSSKNSRLAPKATRRAVSHRTLSCLTASRALPVLSAVPPRHRPGASTQSSDLHTIQFCHLTACRDLALPDKVRSPP